MSDTENELPNLIDRSVKLLFREQPQALLRLVGIEAASVRFEDSVINFAELRADQVFIVEEKGEPTPCAVCVELQLRPNFKLLVQWGLKWLGLCDQLPMDVFLVAIYLEKGDRATFPSRYEKSRGGLRSGFFFNAVCLWDHRERIVSGEWPELAPLLVLCEEHPTEATLEQERDIIRNSGLPRADQTELLGIAMLLATRTFARSVIRSIFREEISMLDMEENLKELLLETGTLQFWARDPRVSGDLLAEAKAEAEAIGIAKGKAEGEAVGIARGKAEGEAVGIARGKAEGEAVGIARGKAEGETEALRRVTLTYLTRQFGELPEALVAQITTADAEACQKLFDRAITATSLSELTNSP